MRKSALLECWQKYRRGKEHFKSFELKISDFLREKPYALAHEYNRERSGHLFIFKILRPLPRGWSLDIGECLHALRSALDYLAWRLAGSDLSDRETQFPIFLTEGGFDKSGRRRWCRMHSGAVAELRESQPYRRENSQRSILWTLQELNAREKHKLLTPIYSHVGIEAFASNSLYPCLVNTNKFIEHDTVIFEVTAPPNANVSVDGYLDAFIAFQNGALPFEGVCRVTDVLGPIVKEVSGILRLFEWRLAENPDWIT
jgi:hypothetical protein